MFRRRSALMVWSVLLLAAAAYAQASAQDGSVVDQRGTPQSPLTVQVAQTQEQAVREQRNEQARRSEQWWTVRIGVVTALILGFQLWVFGRQAKRLRETIETMERIANAQGKDMQTSIAESARAATAMEDLARVTSANRPLFEKLSKVANRAYLAVAFDGATPQDDMNLFEGGAAVINSGNTPALNVRFKAAADILPLSSLADFGFPLPAESEATSISVMGPRMPPKLVRRRVNGRVSQEQVYDVKAGQGNALVMWGVFDYLDIFGEEHTTEFAFSIQWVGNRPDGSPIIMSYDTPRHNNAT